MKYRKKPVVVNAEKWSGWKRFKDCDKYHPVIKPLPLFMSFSIGMSLGSYHGTNGIPPQKLGWVRTLEGGHIIQPGDWLIEGVEGEFYPCKPDIFEKTYEPVELQRGKEPSSTT